MRPRVCRAPRAPRAATSSFAAAAIGAAAICTAASGCAGPGSAAPAGGVRPSGAAAGEEPLPRTALVRLGVSFVDVETGGGVVCRWRVVDEEGFVLEEGVGTRVDRLVPRALVAVEAAPAFEVRDTAELRASFDLLDPANANGVDEEIGVAFDSDSPEGAP